MLQPQRDNINLDQTDDQQDRNNRWLLVWQKCAECAKNNGGRMIQIVDSNIGLSDMQRAEEEIATLLELEITRINSEQLNYVTKHRVAREQRPFGNSL